MPYRADRPRSSRIRPLLNFRQEFLRFDSCHAAGSRGCHSLSKDIILAIATGKHTFDIRVHTRVSHDIALLIELQLALKQLRTGHMADRNEDPIDWQRLL